MGKRSLTAGSGAVLILAAAGLLLPAGAGADAAPVEARSLVAGASAQGMRVGYSVPDLFVVSQFVDAGGPVAQVDLDSTGKAIGFGSLPYPGDNAVGAPGALTGATGVPVPAYPFYARADHPTQPTSEVKDPAGNYDLSAKAEQGKAEGRAALRAGAAEPPVSTVVAQASGHIDASGATMTAVSRSEGLNFGNGLLRIATTTSRSVSTFAPGAAEPATTSELIIEGAKVGEQAVTIGPDGVHPGSQTVTVPDGGHGPDETLAKAGISVRTLSRRNAGGGAAGDALQITVQHPIPGSNAKGTLVYEFGGASSFIALGQGVPALPGVAAPGGTAGSPDGALAAASAAAPVPPDSTPAESGLAASPPARTGRPAPEAFGIGTPPPPEGGTSGPLPSEASAPALTGAAPATVTSEPATWARPDLTRPGRVLLAVLAAAGAVLMAASTLWRRAI